jgi:hypothetical protein
VNTANSDNTSRDGGQASLLNWGRVWNSNSKAAAKTGPKKSPAGEGQLAIARAEKAAQARMAKFRTLKTVSRPNEGFLARVIRRIFG